MADTRRDLQCIIDVFQNHNNRDFHILSFIERMRNLDLINRQQYNNLHSTIEGLGFINTAELLRNLLPHLSYDHLCFLFEEEGYSDISSDLRLKRFLIRYKRLPQREMLHSRRTHDYYHCLKSCIDNNSFKSDIRQQLRHFIHIQDAKIMMSCDEISDNNRQFAMEQKAAATVLLIQHYKDVDDRRLILQQVLASETNGVDNTSLQIVFHSKMAITEADAGNVEEAKEHIVQTKEFCFMYGPCFAVTSALHDIQYTYKSLYFKNPSDEMLENILVEGDIAIQSLTDEREDVQNLWKRIMLLFMVLSLLFITPDFVVCDISKIKIIHKSRAKKILKEIKRCSREIQTRRQMILNLCLAALEESDIKAAEKYAKHAVNDAENGGCFRETEKHNIKAYLKKLHRKMFIQNMVKVLLSIIITIGILFGTIYMINCMTESKICFYVTTCIATLIALVLSSYFRIGF